MTILATNPGNGATPIDQDSDLTSGDITPISGQTPNEITQNIRGQGNAEVVYADEVPPFDGMRLTFEYDLAA